MLAPSHMIVGVVSVLVSAEHLGYTITNPFVYLWAVIGSIFPDIDHKHSRLGRLINPLIVLVIYFLLLSLYPEVDLTPKTILADMASFIQYYFLPLQIITFVLVLTASFICQVWFGHRTITHSFLICFLLTLNLVQTSNSSMFAFSMAYLTHITLDLFSPNGVQFFYPYGRHVNLRPHISNGSFLEGFTVLLVSMILYFASPEGMIWRQSIFSIIRNHFPF